MRLINTLTHELCDIGEKLLGYAILSHTWGEEEVSFAEFAQPEARQKSGFQKIKASCELARSHGIGWLWVDTCCIDKSSSAELSEAINSMYLWYKQAQVCYVYLEDVALSDISWKQSFIRSRWFTRGWTLQELLAPRRVLFFDQTWNFMGTQIDLAPEIFEPTGIHEIWLREGVTPTRPSVAQKMFWASTRNTTRVEDKAYCMLGLFGINMPLLYGEREKAFFRLQQEIIRSTDDETIYAWTSSPFSSSQDASGMLAYSPMDFRYSSGLVQNDRQPYASRSPVTITNKGLQFEILRVRGDGDDALTVGPEYGQNDLFAPLCCHREGDTQRIVVLYFDLEAPDLTTAHIQRIRRVRADGLDFSAPSFNDVRLVRRTFYVNMW